MNTDIDPIVYCPECGQHVGWWHLTSCSERGRVNTGKVWSGAAARRSCPS